MTHFEARPALRRSERERAPSSSRASRRSPGLIHHPDFAVADLSTVRGLLNTGPAETSARSRRALPGVPGLASYGLTERGGVIAFGHLDDPLDQRSTTGGPPVRRAGGADRRPARPTRARARRARRDLLRGPGCSTATTRTRRRPRRRSTRTAGSTRATSARVDGRGRLILHRPAEGHAQGRRRERRARSRSSPTSARIRRSSSRRSSACPTRAMPRCPRRSSSSSPAGADRRGADRLLPRPIAASRSRATCASSTSGRCRRPRSRSSACASGCSPSSGTNDRGRGGRARPARSRPLEIPVDRRPGRACTGRCTGASARTSSLCSPTGSVSGVLARRAPGLVRRLVPRRRCTRWPMRRA